MELGHAAYFVGNRPQVTWAWDLVERNLRFLQGIDAGYFTHIASTHVGLLESEDRHFAAAALRVAYGQATETLLALAAAAVQAPQCVVGWMLSYRNDELLDVVRGMMSASDELERDPSVADPSLEGLAESVMSATSYEPSKREQLAAGFGRLWRRFAAEFLDEIATSEYNSFKHGMRASLGGFTLSIGPEAEFGVAPAPEAMRSLGGSVFGSAFYRLENLDGRLHQFPRRTTRNWSPSGMVYGLQLIAMSIQDIVSYLRITGGDDPARCRFDTPLAPESFELPWQQPVGVTSSSMDIVVRRDHIQPLSRDEVVKLLAQTRRQEPM